MRIGIGAGMQGSLDDLIREAQRAEAAGFSGLWMANAFGLDAINALAIVGRETKRIELGTAVVPTYPRHPFAIAQQALTTQAATHGRFVLGIGLSHKVVIENMLGMSYDRPALHMREYLEVLTPLLCGKDARFKGDQYSVAGALTVPEADPVPLLVAALGPVMLRLAGRFADGTITWMTGPKTLESHIIPTIREAAKAAGRPDPRIIAGFPVAVTDDVAAARETIGKVLQMYGMLPSYRAMLDREGAEGPADVSVVGNEAEVRSKLAHLREIGVTDFDAVVVPIGRETKRTFDLLAGEV